jgi:hypothetical protein
MPAYENFTKAQWVEQEPLHFSTPVVGLPPTTKAAAQKKERQQKRGTSTNTSGTPLLNRQAPPVDPASRAPCCLHSQQHQAKSHVGTSVQDLELHPQGRGW